MEICLNVLMSYGGLHVKIERERSKYKWKLYVNWISMVFHMKLHIYILVSAGMINEMSNIIFSRYKSSVTLSQFFPNSSQLAIVSCEFAPFCAILHKNGRRAKFLGATPGRQQRAQVRGGFMFELVHQCIAMGDTRHFSKTE